ncbi:MAG: selenide, water dikinase SelD [Chloroflexi bacterium]|nr:selenide, water dikinase SelD [Chloroflexota bacterium]
MFQAKNYPALLVGLAAPDDAAVYQLNELQAIISTVDFFPPVVDESYEFGAIAAANALSDVYAMGAVAGGHTVTDKEPKYGLAVTGIVHPNHIFTKGGARAGDIIILTKPLGTGTITTAIKRGLCDAADARGCIDSMMKLNRDASRAAKKLGEAVHAVTDITGFGLLGHAHEMAHLSECAIRFNFESLPWLSGAQNYARQLIFPGGAERNEAFYSQWVTFERGLESWEQRLMFDPQTSGGLLLAIDAARAEEFLKTIPSWKIADVVEGAGGAIFVR